MTHLADPFKVTSLTLLMIFAQAVAAEESHPKENRQRFEITSEPALPYRYDVSVSWYFTHRSWVGAEYGKGIIRDHSWEALGSNEAILVGNDFANGYVDSSQKRDAQVFVGHQLLEGWPFFVSAFGGVLGKEHETYTMAHSLLERAAGFPPNPDPALTYTRWQLTRPYAGTSAGVKFVPGDLFVVGLEIGWVHFNPLRQRIDVQGNLGGLLPGALQIGPNAVLVERYRETSFFPRSARNGQMWRLFGGFRVDWSK